MINADFQPPVFSVALISGRFNLNNLESRIFYIET